MLVAFEPRVQLGELLQRLGARLEHGRHEQLEVDAAEVGLLDPGHRRHLAVRAGHVLGDQAPNPAQRLPPALRARSGACPPDVAASRTSCFGHASLRARPGERLEVDAELLGEPADERRRADTAVGATSRGLSPDTASLDGFGCGEGPAAPSSPMTTSTVPTGTTLALLDEDLRDLARRRRGDLDRRLVRLDLDERLVLGDLVAHRHEPARDLALGQALAEIGKLELVRHGDGTYRGRPTQASGGTIRTRSPPSTRQSEIACSSPASLRRDLARDVADLQRPSLVPDRDRVRVVLVVRLGHERKR